MEPPTVVGSVSSHRLLVVASALLVAAGAVAYTYSQPKTFTATAEVSMVQPTGNAGLGIPAAASPQQYVESQLLVLESGPVAAHAATLADAALHTTGFTASQFSGPKSVVKITTQTSVEPNSGLVTVAFHDRDPQRAAAGANALVGAYVDAQQASIARTYASMSNALTSSMQAIDSQLAALNAPGTPQDPQLTTSLVTQRTALQQQLSLVSVGQQAAATSTPAVAQAYVPSSPSNRKLTKVVPVGLIVGAVLGACLAYAVESSRRRRTTVDQPATGRLSNGHVAGGPSGWDGFEELAATEAPSS